MRNIYNLLFLVIVLALSSCDNEGTLEPAPKSILKLEGIENSDCTLGGLLSKRQDCLNIKYDGKDTLRIYHVNAGFNCCPFDFNIPVVLENDTIKINESVVNGDCECDCLFDVSYSVSGIKPGSYTIVIDEKIRMSYEEDISLQTDLKKQKTASICLDRDDPIWNM